MLTSTNFQNFVSTAYSYGIKVYILTGHSIYLKESNFNDVVTNFIDEIVEYNNSVSIDKKIAGIHYDVEAWAVSTDEFPEAEYGTWKNKESFTQAQIDNKDYYLDSVDNPSRLRQMFVTFVEKSAAYAKEKNVSIAYDLTYWLVPYYYVNSAGEQVNILNHIATKASNYNIMVFSNTRVNRYINERGSYPYSLREWL